MFLLLWTKEKMEDKIPLKNDEFQNQTQIQKSRVY